MAREVGVEAAKTLLRCIVDFEINCEFIFEVFLTFWGEHNIAEFTPMASTSATGRRNIETKEAKSIPKLNKTLSTSAKR